MGYSLPTTYSYNNGFYPYSGVYPYSGLNAYSGLFPHGGLGYPFLPVAAKEEAAVESARKKRSAEPEAEAEADPQLLLSTGLTGLHTPYTYPLNYRTAGLPLTYGAAGLPLTYGSAGLPLTYRAGLPLTYGYTGSYTYPLGTTYHHAGLPVVAAAVAKE